MPDPAPSHGAGSRLVVRIHSPAAPRKGAEQTLASPGRGAGIPVNRLGGPVQRQPARQLEPDLWLLDLDFQGSPGVVAAFLVTGAEGHTLVETGPGSTLGALDRAVRAAGARLEDVTQ